MLTKFFYAIKRHKTAYLFLLPTVVLVLGFLISPIFSGVGMSFYKSKLSGEVTFVGLQNYMRLFKETRFLNNMKLTLIYVVGNLILSTPLAYIAAILITQKMKATNFFRGIFLLPWITAPVVSALLAYRLPVEHALACRLIQVYLALSGHLFVGGFEILCRHHLQLF